MTASIHPRLTFHGAARTVTGSCFLLEAAGQRILVDCGMVQGSKSEKELNYRAFPFSPAGIKAVLLTHAHIDHSGLLPKLVKHGFDGPIYATRASVDLCAIMLRDSGHIQETEVAQLNRRNARRGRRRGQLVEPIYTAREAEQCLVQFRPVDYGAWTAIAPGVRARFWNAGHLLGSASIEVELERAGTKGAGLRLLFSGDIGPDHKLLQPEPEGPHGLDYLICEATYGDRDRLETSPEARRRLLRDEVRAAAHSDGALLIPSFAVERTQELLVDLVALMNAGEIARAPIIIDSPLATKASDAFARHADELENGAALIEALRAHNVRFTETADQSRALDRLHEFHIVIAASGMCEAGRIRHRLKNWLWRETGTVLLVGFQAQGTLGRVLQDGATRVRIQGEEIAVRARIRSLDLYSGHADGPELVAWVRERLPVRQRLFLVHGETSALEAIRERLKPLVSSERILVPSLDDAYELTSSDGARVMAASRPRRIAPERVGRPDAHNELAELLLDIGATVEQAADERAKAVVIRRLRRALGPAGG